MYIIGKSNLKGVLISGRVRCLKPKKSPFDNIFINNFYKHFLEKIMHKKSAILKDLVTEKKR